MKTLNMMINAAALALAAGVAPLAAHTHATAPQADAAVASGASTAEQWVGGVVRKIDRDAGKLTLRHEPIPNLDMPEMTMVYRVSEATLLDGLKAGDKVRFAADKVNGQFTVTAIQAAP